MTIVALLTLVPIVSSSAHANAAPDAIQPLLPSSPWVVDGEEGQCFLQRNFASGKSTLTLVLKPIPFTDGFSLVLRGKGDLPTGLTTGQIELAPSGQQLRSDVLGDRLVDGNVSLRLSPHEMKVPPGLLTGTTSITVRVDRFAQAVATPGIDAALKVLKDCNQALVQSWGIDPQEHDRIETAAEPLTRSDTWLDSSDYPQPALASGLQGSTNVLYAIDPSGRVKECRTIVSSGDKGLDAKACQGITTHAYFSPATDVTGKPVESHRVQSINWRIGP